MNPTKAIDEALIIIGKARMGKIPCNEALDRLWEILVNLDFELKTANINSDEAALKPQLMN
ncbi:hypothetical protein JCM16161A_01550 [Vulcanisaeta sp. JCM 16161]|uniref:hypothetical protein n=1 Tax=Vulcanisaeta sp. JCM 16161 TaxID=1295372 RepID=UPI0006D266F6|nr:hypothetical protein [Vulcanisaeta sp. JCM 16161]